MLRKNPLNPPRPLPSATGGAAGPAAGETDEPRPPAAAGFISAEAFDATGILTGVDPAEPRYWWMPELYGLADPLGDGLQEPPAGAGAAAAGGAASGGAQAAARSADKTAA